MAKRTLKAKIERDPVRKVASRVHDISGAPGGRTPRQVAVNTLKKLAPTLKIEPDLKTLRFDKVKKTVLGSHVLFQQIHRGKPISGAWIRVDIDRDGKVYNVLNDLVPQPKVDKAERQEDNARSKAGPELKQADVRARALAEAGGDAAGAEMLLQELVYYPVDAVPVRAWKVVVHTSRPLREWKMYLDALSGQVLERTDLLKLADGQGRVFNPNPVVSLNDTAIEDNSAIPPAAYVTVTLKDLKAGGHLDGPFVSTKRTPDRVRRTNLKFTFSRSDRPFKEVMAYFHIDAAQRYIQDLGFDNILNRPIEVHIDGRTDDNSHYSPTTKSLTFGTGGVDDAEDAEIILHEYGHAIQDDQVPGWGASAEASAMGEGFGDYFAASFFAESKPQILRPTVGSWDAVAYSGAEPPCLRRLDSNKNTRGRHERRARRRRDLVGVLVGAPRPPGAPGHRSPRAGSPLPSQEDRIVRRCCQGHADGGCQPERRAQRGGDSRRVRASWHPAECEAEEPSRRDALRRSGPSQRRPACSSPAPAKEPLMIVVLVRHAEPLAASGNPGLSTAGTRRAAVLARMLAGSGVTAVFTSDLRRTKDTAAPLAQLLSIAPVEIANNPAAAATQIKAAGERVVVVGHSNTVPAIIKALGGPPDLQIGPTEFDRMFVLHVPAVSLLTMAYGD